MISEVNNIDCVEYMRSLPDKCFDLCIADPPYGIKPHGEAQNCLLKYGQLETANNMRPGPEFFEEIRRVSKHLIVWGYNHLSKELGPCKEFIVWYKHNPLHTFSDGELAYTDFDRVARVFDYPYYSTVNSDKQRIHPTQKPVALYAWLLNNYAKPGDTIFDPMMGGQSSRIAAYRMGMNYIGCELDSTYFREGCERFDRECRGIEIINGTTIIQKELFSL